VVLKLKKYESKVLEILDNGDAVIEIPNELIDVLDWNIGDELNFVMLDDGVRITNITKDNKNGSESKA
jgi:antitoxin component of MazEF toxin-antitoxin module